MKSVPLLAGLAMLAACPAFAQLPEDFVELAAMTNPETPSPRAESNYPQEVVERGRYLTGLLACGSCHTNGALLGAPMPQHLLAGSDTGIAWTNPEVDANPPIVYPANLTPDVETGLGRRTLNDIVEVLRSGIDSHTGQNLQALPWPRYPGIAPNDATAIAAYLLSLPPVSHEVPANVQPGGRSATDYVYFGVYEASGADGSEPDNAGTPNARKPASVIFRRFGPRTVEVK